ncbi:terminase [Acinetobacter sp. LoGeW2-3]|uniref:phage terminase small subunit n=1 Tax=Acinetobacter sp. LoGeW2-3 TaxID=1808001 RepID=UPI000C05BCA4|nr:phage terminase small subunit [Acinetobacter sp. LoGeW2-3]ATO19986.1 terminase [Acinetobacter sp. LoGeW2-3]
MSLARRHFQKHSAKAAAETAAEFGTMQEQSFYELQLAQLNNDRHRLKQIQSTEAKIQLKKALVPTYLPYVDGIIEANKSVQDVVFMTVLVWCIDVENYAKALEMAEFALVHNMIMPDRFERKTATLVTEEIANAFLKKLKTNADIDIEVLQQLEQLALNTEFEEKLPDMPDQVKEKLPDMPDQVKAKLLVALGKATIKQIQSKDEPSQSDIEFAQEAQAYLERAIELDDKCGGKQDLKNMETLLKKFPPQTPKQAEPLLNADGSQLVDDQGNLSFKPT